MLLILAHIPDVMASHLINRSNGGPNNIRNAESMFSQKAHFIEK